MDYDAYARRLFQIESGGNPNAQTGSNRGLGQFGPSEERRYGITPQNRTDPAVQMRAVTQEAMEQGKALTRVLGREPTPGELYLAHQQGLAGATAHLMNPDKPAWQSVSPYYGSDAVARKAIWGNIPDAQRGTAGFNKGMFPGGVDNLSSRDFAQGWINKFENAPSNTARDWPAAGPSNTSGTGVQASPGGAASPATAPSGSQAPAATPPTSPGAGMLAGADLSGGQQQGGPDIGQLAQRALLIANLTKPPPVQPLQPIPMPVPPGLRARLQNAALGEG